MYLSKIANSIIRRMFSKYALTLVPISLSRTNGTLRTASPTESYPAMYAYPSHISSESMHRFGCNRNLPTGYFFVLAIPKQLNLYESASTACATPTCQTTPECCTGNGSYVIPLWLCCVISQQHGGRSLHFQLVTNYATLVTRRTKNQCALLPVSHKLGLRMCHAAE